LRGQEDFFSRQPIAGIRDEITYRPILLVKDELVDVAEVIVESLDGVSCHVFDAAQMGVAALCVA
jgi:hypothetical protein